MFKQNVFLQRPDKGIEYFRKGLENIIVILYNMTGSVLNSVYRKIKDNMLSMVSFIGW